MYLNCAVPTASVIMVGSVCRTQEVARIRDPEACAVFRQSLWSRHSFFRYHLRANNFDQRCRSQLPIPSPREQALTPSRHTLDAICL